MMEDSKILEKRIDKIKEWFKNPYNLGLFLIILASIIIRIYYFILTKNQPIWWDEAEYLNIARRWAFGIDFKFDAVRPVLFSFITAIFLKISNSEFLPRVFILILSVFSVYGAYLCGKEFYNKRIGLLTAIFISFFYLNLFFTFRLIVDIPSLAFFTFSMLLFYKYFKTGSNKALYWATVMIAIGTLFKQSTGFLFFGVLIYFLITEKLNFLKKKELWIAGFIFILILSPYIIWGYFEYNGFVLTKGPALVTPENPLTRGIEGIKGYFGLFPTYFSWPILILFFLGLISMHKLFLGFDILIKKGNPDLKKEFFLLLMFLVPIILASFTINHNEDRYIINAMPAFFIITSLFINNFYEFVKKKNKIFAVLIILVILFFALSFQIKSTDNLIKGKVNSYSQIRDAGLWIKENSEPENLIISSSAYQVMYYSKRKSILFPLTKEEYENDTLSKNPKYFMISIFEGSPDWVNSYPQENNYTVSYIIFMDPEKTKPMVIVYEINST